MAGLFGAIWLALQCGASAKEAKERKDALSKPSYTAPETGQAIYHDNHLRAYGKNGEKLEPKYTRMPNGELRIQMVGKRSGIIYEDNYARQMQKNIAQDEKNLNTAKKYGDLAYLKYNETYKCSYTTEISSGKIIAAISADDVNKIYRKFYLKEKPLGRYTSASNGDFGIPITKFEYDKYNIVGGTHSKTEALDMIGVIGKEADPYYGIEDKYLFDIMHGNDSIGNECIVYGSGKGIVIDVKDYNFVVDTERFGKKVVKPSLIHLLGKKQNYKKCIINDNGIEKQGVVKKKENGQYLIEFKDGSTRYVDAESCNIKLL